MSELIENNSYPKMLIKIGIATTADSAGTTPPAIFQSEFLVNIDNLSKTRTEIAGLQLLVVGDQIIFFWLETLILNAYL